jgi:hypothetical protein
MLLFAVMDFTVRSPVSLRLIKLGHRIVDCLALFFLHFDLLFFLSGHYLYLTFFLSRYFPSFLIFFFLT